METFAYSRAKDTAEAIALASKPSSRFLAGGTTLIDLMKLSVETPKTVVDVNRVPLAQIEVGDKGVRIGATARNTDVAYHAEIQKRYPVLSQAILAGASPQIRNMATVGGNLMQRTRCYYFRDASAKCNKRTPGSGCDALEGFNRNCAVLGTSDKCIASHPSDMCVALAILDAVVQVEGPKGKRSIPFGEFHVSYGDDPAKETVLEPGELITVVELPSVPWATKSCYVKVRDRESYEFALASAAVALEVAGGAIKTARVALGGVATKPWRAVEAEKSLVGAKLDITAFGAAADAALKDAKGRANNSFKIELAKRTMVRALTTAAALG
jgi:xanthine dehydrogenase YagS FAD-binding subunit